MSLVSSVSVFAFYGYRYLMVIYSVSQALLFEKEATILTCNLFETVHNKWLQASGGKMLDVYHATVDDFAQATLQSLFYYNYLRRGQSGTGPSKCELELCFASRQRNTKRVVKLLDEVSPAKYKFGSVLPSLSVASWGLGQSGF